MSPEVASRVIALFREIPAARKRRLSTSRLTRLGCSPDGRRAQLQDGRRRSWAQRQHASPSTCAASTRSCRCTRSPKPSPRRCGLASSARLTPHVPYLISGIGQAAIGHILKLLLHSAFATQSAHARRQCEIRHEEENIMMRHRRINTTLALVAIAIGLAASATVWPASRVAAIGNPDIQPVDFGLIGLSPGQTLRLTVLNPALIAPPEPDARARRARLTLTSMRLVTPSTAPVRRHLSTAPSASPRCASSHVRRATSPSGPARPSRSPSRRTRPTPTSTR